MKNCRLPFPAVRVLKTDSLWSAIAGTKGAREAELWQTGSAKLLVLAVITLWNCCNLEESIGSLAPYNINQIAFSVL